jgi:hypothetical protein
MEILADALEVDDSVDPERFQIIAITHAGQHQQLGRLDLTRGADLARLPALPIFDADSALAVQEQPVTCALVRTMRLRRPRTGCRYATAVLIRRPLRMVCSEGPKPSGAAPL